MKNQLTLEIIRENREHGQIHTHVALKDQYCKTAITEDQKDLLMERKFLGQVLLIVPVVKYPLRGFGRINKVRQGTLYWEFLQERANIDAIKQNAAGRHEPREVTASLLDRSPNAF